MMKRQHCFAIISLKLFCFFIITTIITASTAMAENHAKTLKVAFYPLEGFFEYDKSGKETGYGVDVLNKISQYSGIQFEYVKADSWEDTKPMLLSGEADIRMPATKPSKPSTTLSYNNTSILDTYHVIMTKSDRNNLYYNDFDTIKQLKIAVSESFYNSDDISKKFLKSIDISESNLVFVDDYNASRKMLEDGSVDAIISNVMDMDKSLKLLARFNSISNFISMTIDNPILGEIDNTIAKIKLDEPLFLSETYENWFPDRTVMPLTIDESRYLDSVKELTFAFREDEGYLQRFEDGEFRGIYIEQAKAICKNLGVEFNAVSMEDCSSGKAKADVYAGFFYDQSYAEKWNFAITAPVDDINYYMIQKKDVRINESTCKIAAVQKFRYTSDYLQKKYKPEQIIYCDTYEQCLKKIESGKADIAIINNYIAEYYLEKYQYSDLAAKLTTEYSHLYCFAMSNNNEILASVLSKTFSSLPESEKRLIYISGTEQKSNNNVIASIIYRHPFGFTLFVAGILAIIIIFLLLLIFIRKSKEQNKVLSQALSAKSDFLARMSHDMRTPLNAVLGFSDIALDNINDSNAVSDFLKKIKSSGRYLLGLINDVLDASKIESGKLSLNTEIVEGNIFLTEIADEFASQAKEKNINFIANLEKANTPYVKMDKLRTRQIYSNLLNNALKFSEPYSTVEWYMEDDETINGSMSFLTKIIDHGRGMSKEFMEHMFDPFTQEIIPGKELAEGTGLGLMIVKKLVELSNGTITVESELGKGTTFTLRMKREIPTGEEIKEYEANKVKKTDYNYTKLKNKRVLLCEDHKTNREIAVRMLNRVGISTECAENGQIGVDKLKQSAAGYYDAVLMDIKMPVMGGIDAAKEIRTFNSHIPIIAVTANAYKDDIEESLEAGMNKHLSKPIEPEELYKTLDSLLS